MRIHRRRVVSTIAAVATAAALGLVAIPAASAAVITNDVFTSLTMTAADGTPLPSGVSPEAPVAIHFGLDIPNSAVRGDTFAVTMPVELLAADLTYNVVATGTTDAIANCAMASRVLTCTLTDYVTSHDDITGSMTVVDQLNVDALPTPVTYNLDFGLARFAPIPVVVDGAKGALTPNQASKGGGYRTGVATWEVRLPKNMGLPITVTDTPGAGQNCSANAELVGYYDRYGREDVTALTGTAAGGNITWSVAATPGKYKQYAIRYTCAITDANRANVTNAATVVGRAGRTERVNASITLPGGNGNGDGTDIPVGPIVDNRLEITSMNYIYGGTYTSGVYNVGGLPYPYRNVYFTPPNGYLVNYRTVEYRGNGTPGETVEVYREAWIAGLTTSVQPNCTAVVAAAGTWACSSTIDAIPRPQGNGWAQASVQDLNVRTVRGMTTYIGENRFRINSLYNCPIAIDFSGTGTVGTVDAFTATNTFDILGNGTSVGSGWLAPSAGFLAYDADGDGVISSVNELFGGQVGEGFAKLAEFDTNGDGVIDANDAGYSLLSIWVDANSNKVTDAGELVSLAEVGVVSLSLDHSDYASFDAAGNVTYERSTATLADGTAAAMNGMYFALNG